MSALDAAPRNLRRSDAKSEIEKKKHTACYIDAKGNQLLVPTVSMWKLHAASTPVQILKRSNLPGRLWDNWKEKLGEAHWAFDWLYRKSDPPENISLMYASRRKEYKRGPRDGEFFADEEMVRFREQASQRRIAAAAKLTKSTVRHSVKKYAHLWWFEDWLLRGADAPEDWQISTEGEILRCQAAWNYREFQRRLSIDRAMYYWWIRELFPQNQLREWLGWLYGGPAPDGWFIISNRMEALRKRLSVAGIAEAAEVASGTYYGWLQDELQAEALHDAIKAAGENKSGEPKPPNNSAAWHALFSEPLKQPTEWLRQGLLRWAEAATLRAALRDLSFTGWQGYRTQARRIGEEHCTDHRPDSRILAGETFVQTLTDYITGRLGGRQFGVIIPGLFAPPDGMLSFRKVASSEISKQRICQVRNRLPEECFAKWMLDCILPTFNLRHLLQMADPRRKGASAESNSPKDPPRPLVPETSPESKADHTDLPKSVAETPHVKLFGKERNPLVCGKLKERLTDAEYSIVWALIEARKSGEKITKDLFPMRAGVEGARQIFDRMRKRDPDWAQVLLPSGRERLGYRII